jgi:truncated hemoglobin YjbI
MQHNMLHAIKPEPKEEWLKCMKETIATLPIEEGLKIELYKAFLILAQQMVNR